ncbi:MAG TPA: hypothetical protein VF377_14145 [Acidimicrobiia bacterium]
MSDPTEHLRRYAEDIASAVSPARSRIAAMEAIGRVQELAPVRSRRPLAYKVQVAGALMAGFFVLNFATAAVADNAVPGDSLYFLDRTYERIAGWFGDTDHQAERAAEAQVLLERGDVPGALQVLAEASQVTELRDTAAMVLAAGLDGETLAEHARNLVAYFEVLAADEDPRSRQEALAAVRLVATQVEAKAPASPSGAGRSDERPSHADETGRPDHAGGPGAPADTPSGTSPAETGSSNPPDHADETGPPDHAGQTGPPDHAADPDGNGSSSGQGGSSSGGSNQGSTGGSGRGSSPPGNSGGSGPPSDASEPGPPDNTGQQGPPAQGGSSGAGGQSNAPGQGNSTPPGQGGSNPGKGNTDPPGQSGSNPGQGNATPPGQGGSNPGQGDSTPPGQGGPNPGKGNAAP